MTFSTKTARSAVAAPYAGSKSNSQVIESVPIGSIKLPDKPVNASNKIVPGHVS